MSACELVNICETCFSFESILNIPGKSKLTRTLRKKIFTLFFMRVQVQIKMAGFSVL